MQSLKKISSFNNNHDHIHTLVLGMLNKFHKKKQMRAKRQMAVSVKCPKHNPPNFIKKKESCHRT